MRQWWFSIEEAPYIVWILNGYCSINFLIYNEMYRNWKHTLWNFSSNLMLSWLWSNTTQKYWAVMASAESSQLCCSCGMLYSVKYFYTSFEIWLYGILAVCQVRCDVFCSIPLNLFEKQRQTDRHTHTCVPICDFIHQMHSESTKQE